MKTTPRRISFEQKLALMSGYDVLLYERVTPGDPTRPSAGAALAAIILAVGRASGATSSRQWR